MMLLTKTVRHKVALVLLATYIIGARPASATYLEPAVALQGQQYAVEPRPTTRFDGSLIAASDETLDDLPTLRYRDVHIYSFFEPGKNGDFSFDVDDSAVRIPVSNLGHVWFGRVQPLAEAWPTAHLNHTDAIGSVWVQNQSDALSPRVSGWIGTGAEFHDKKTGISGVFAFSPIFIPTSGPRLSLSAETMATGSRFSRLPPSYADINGQLLPLHYQLDLNRDDIKSIVLQNQFFGSVGWAAGPKATDASFQFMAWSAPTPDPQVGANGILMSDDSTVHVGVTATPTFPRKNYLAARAVLPVEYLSPTFQAAYELGQQQMVLSGEIGSSTYLYPFTLSGGFLHALSAPNASVSTGGADVITPSYNRYLGWTEASVVVYHEKIVPSVRIEQHFGPMPQRGQLIEPKVTYRAAQGIDVFAVGDIIDGQDQSYFGAWRSLDSVAMGATFRW